ncbi:MAG: response regulator [bacterium]|nr:MAG: response regulator [bacterium]
MNEKNATILVVDDDPSIQEIIRIILQRAGYDVHLAEDGEEAVHRFGEIKPDLVISDISMPRGDGFNVAIVIRSLDMERKTPILLISAFYDDDANRENAERCGADGFLSKPFTQKQLVGKVEELLGSARNHG